MSALSKYLNPFHDSTTAGAESQYYTTSAKPKNYRGYQIFRRLPNCHDYVINGVCVAQRVGYSAAFVDDLIEGKSFWALRAKSFEKHGAANA